MQVDWGYLNIEHANTYEKIELKLSEQLSMIIYSFTSTHANIGVHQILN